MALIDEPVFWRSNPETSLYSVLIANVWYGTPFNMILLAVGLSQIPEDL